MHKLIALAAGLAFLLSACTTPGVTPPTDVPWRHEAIVQIGAAASMPSYVDRHCMAPDATGAGEGEEALMLSFRVGRARYYQAFPTAPGAGWKVGDKVLFDSDTCRIRGTGSPRPDSTSRRSEERPADGLKTMPNTFATPTTSIVAWAALP